MAKNKKLSYNEIPDLSEDWGLDPRNGLKYSGESVQAFIKKEFGKKFGYINMRFNDAEMMYYIECFASEDNFNKYEEDKETYASLRLQNVQIPISTAQGDTYSALLRSSIGNTSDIVVTENKLEIPFNFRAVKITVIGNENAGYKGTLHVQRSTDNGTTWNDVGTIPNALTSYDYETSTEEKVDLGQFLAQGKQMLRVRASYTYQNEEGEERTVNSSYVYVGASVTRTRLSLDLVTNYEIPMDAFDVNGNANPFSVTYTVYGSVQKTHYVRIDNGSPITYGYDASVDSVNKTVSANVASYMTHGVHKVETWLECEDGLGNILKSAVLVNRFMVVNKQTSGADLTKPYLLLQNVDSEIDNFVQTEIAEYAVYSPSGENIDVAFLLTAYTEDFETSKPEEYFRLETTVEPRKPYSLLTTIEIENEDEGTEILKYDTYFRVRRITASTDTDFMNESTGEKSYYIMVDNSNAFTPVSGATFLMNPKVRNNNEANPFRILNAKNNNAEVESVWTNADLINGMWTTAEDNQKVLRIMAGTTLEIKKNIWAQFLSNPNSSLTFEMDFKIDNVTNLTDPIVRMFEGTVSSFKGLCMNALEGWIMNASNTSKDNCLFSWQEGVRTHMSINLHHQVKPNKGDVNYTAENASKANGTMALARVIINGDCVREIPFSTTNANEWCSTSSGSIIIGNEGADIDIYSIRIYEGKVVEMTDILNRNYLASLPTAEAKAKLKDKNDLLDGGRISLEKTKNKGLNCMVWHGKLPFHGDQAEQTGWVEIFRYDSDGNYLPEYSGTNCKETKSLKGKGQGSTAKTYYDWNLQEDNSKVEATIKVALNKIHSEIHVSEPYTGEDGQQYVDIYGGNLGKNIPIETEANAQAYPYANGMVTVPDGWIDGNGMYRGMGYRVAEGTSLAQKKVIKINYASSMQSHLIGACNTYDLLHRKVVGNTPLQEVIPDAVSAKRTEPFMFFNQEEGKDVYFKGMGTYGAGKADKVTWGFVKKQMPMYALIEGSDNNLPMTGFRVPFDKNTAVYSVDDEGWLYNGQQSFDFDLGNTDDNDVPTDAITQRWADIHNFIYLHSTNLKYFNGTYEEFLQSSAAEDTNYKYWCTQGEQAFALKRYDFVNKTWVDAGLTRENSSSYMKFDMTLRDETINAINSWKNEGSGDYGKLNELLKDAFISHMKLYLKYFVNEKSLQFNYCYVLGFLAGTDNSDKNTYYKIMPIGMQMEENESFVAWYTGNFHKEYDFTSVHQLYFDGDDMDSIFRTNNNSHQTKPYYIDRMHPYADGSTVSLYEGMGNQLFNFVEKAYESTGELSAMMNQIMIAATELVSETDKLYGLENGKVSLWGFLHKYFFNIQHYFPQIAYMEQARIRYEFPELLGFISSGGGARSIRPITQSLGSQLQNELQYMNQRVIYMTSYAAFGAWGGDSSHSIGLADANETFSFTPAAMPDGSPSTYTFTITPHQYIYPSHFYGGTFTSTRQRTSPKQTCTFTIAENVQGSDTGMGVCGINYISDLGDLKDKSIASDLIVNGKRLKRLRCTYSTTFRPSNLQINANNLVDIYIRLDRKMKIIDMSKQIRCKSIDIYGNVEVGIYPQSNILTSLTTPWNPQYIELHNIPNLKSWNFNTVSESFYIGDNVGTNVEGFTVQPIVEKIYSSQKSQSNPNLQSIHVENVNWTDFDVEALSWFADRPTCEFKGTIGIKETSELANAITWDLKNKFNLKFGNVDDASSSEHKGLLLSYNKRVLASATLTGNIYHKDGKLLTHQFGIKPNNDYVNTQTKVRYSLSGLVNTVASIHPTSGLLTVTSLSDTEERVTVTATITLFENGAVRTYTVSREGLELWNRPAKLGDAVYYDGSYGDPLADTGEKSSIGTCFYLAPRKADGSVNEVFANPSDKQLRLMYANKNLAVPIGGSNTSSLQFGCYPISSDEGTTLQYSLFETKEDGTRANLTVEGLTSVYDIPTIANISTNGLTVRNEDGTETSTSYITDASMRDEDTNEGIANDGFKPYSAGVAAGDGFAYKETATQLTARTLTEELALLTGGLYKAGDIVNSSYAKTLKIIQHRNILLNNGFQQVGLPALPPPEATTGKSETQALGELIDYLRAWAKDEHQDAYPNKWSQIAYPLASACYAYEPTGLKAGEVLDARFKAHAWFAPTRAILDRVYWYIFQAPDDKNIFFNAISKGLFTKSSASYHWSVTENTSGYSWSVYFNNGYTLGSYKGSSLVGRAVSAF